MIGIDADDTLWHNERLFWLTEQRFVELVAPFADGSDVAARLLDTERANLAHRGYGVNSFVLSMIETAIDVTHGQVPSTVIGQLVEAGRAMMAHPVELFDGVAETLTALGRRWPLVLITKGDLFHQESKVARSGLAHLFAQVEIVSDKTTATYRRIMDRAGVVPSDFVMVGDSLRSDIVPVLELGGRAIHIPGFREWELERAEPRPHHAGRWWRAASLAEVLPLLERIAAPGPGDAY